MNVDSIRSVISMLESIEGLPNPEDVEAQSKKKDIKKLLRTKQITVPWFFNNLVNYNHSTLSGKNSYYTFFIKTPRNSIIQNIWLEYHIKSSDTYTTQLAGLSPLEVNLNEFDVDNVDPTNYILKSQAFNKELSQTLEKIIYNSENINDLEFVGWNEKPISILMRSQTFNFVISKMLRPLIPILIDADDAVVSALKEAAQTQIAPL